VFAQAAHDEGNLLFRYLRIRPVGPEALGVKVLERLAGQFQTALAGVGFGGIWRHPGSRFVHGRLYGQSSAAWQRAFLRPL
jgi:hypothetical protein